MVQANVQFQTLLDFFKALANESRLKLLGILAQQECSVEELAARLELTEPTVSHHLSKLKALELVQMRPVGNVHLYQLNNETLKQLNIAFSQEQMTTWVDDSNQNAWETKVLKNYMDGALLKEIPASRKKRLVILKWLANRFQFGTTYPEQTVNEIIKRHHPDCATLRRELVGYRLMQRENGLYWRLPDATSDMYLSH
ncbi:MAG: metalloregulator ArsR/SmtB family transcription factor [Cyanophyceae cyanobacterium]